MKIIKIHLMKIMKKRILYLRIIQIIRIRVMLKFYLCSNGMDWDNYGFINFLISFLLMIIMKMITLLDIFRLRIINGLFNLDGDKLIFIRKFINRFIKINRFVGLKWIKKTIIIMNNKDF